MALRVLVLIIGVLTAAVGISLFFMQDFWYSTSRTILDSSQFRYWGVVSIVFGLILIAAAAARQVGLLPVIWFLGLFTIATGIVIILRPHTVADFIRTIYINKPADSRVFILFLSGLMRTVAGFAMIMAAIFRPLRNLAFD